ncbi:MAG TPA: HAMP domain-containing sensor histidine kinase [Treponemataceae bacterium]|nr:HAMP domain-containing sensor histidine kinase [Treponemataceae bacterium]
MLYNSWVMNREYRLYRIIPLITLPLIAMLAWNQFNWLQELRDREDRRIEASMVGSTMGLSTRLRDEITLLPALFRLAPEDRADMDTLLRERYRFWRRYAIDSAILKDIYAFDGNDDSILRWQDERLRPIPAREGPQHPPLDTEGDGIVRIVSPIILSPDRQLMADFAFDKREIVSRVIPKLAKECLDSSGLYLYRIIDTESGREIYASASLDNTRIAEPDIEVHLIDSDTAFVSSGGNRPFPRSGNRPPAGQGEPESDNGPRWVLRARPSDNAMGAEEPERTFMRPGRMPQHDFDNITLQIFNRDGSLERISRRASLINALVSMGTFALLTVLIAALIRTNGRARKLAQRQREFIATITHELKTPLSVIISAADNLNDGLVRDQNKAEQYGTLIKREAARLALSIDDFLLYSKTDSAGRVKPAACDLGAIIANALKATEDERARLKIRTEVSLPAEPAILMGDGVALESVFLNLAQNVVKHAASGQYLGIIVSREKGRKNEKNFTESLIIKVKDLGPGIPVREQKLIFEPFARGKRAIEEQIPGNGIGLNLVKRIVEMHGGSISVESKPESGSTFTVTLPQRRGANDAWQNTDD